MGKKKGEEDHGCSDFVLDTVACSSSFWLIVFRLFLFFLLSSPAIDGSPYGLLDRPIELIRQGKTAQVPVIMGINKDEVRWPRKRNLVSAQGTEPKDLPLSVSKG